MHLFLFWNFFFVHFTEGHRLTRRGLNQKEKLIISYIFITNIKASLMTYKYIVMVLIY